MESNEPVNKIKSNQSWSDGIWDGAAIGAMGGIGTVGLVHGGRSTYGSQRRANRLAEKAGSIQEKMQDLGNSQNPTVVDKRAKLQKKLGKVEGKAGKQADFNAHKRLGGFKTAAVYGGSALIGGIAGGVIDSVNG